MWPPKSDSQIATGNMAPKQSDSKVDNTRTRRNSWPVFVTRGTNTLRTTAVNTTITMAAPSPSREASRDAIASEEEQLRSSTHSSMWSTTKSSNFRDYSDYSLNTSLNVGKTAVFGEHKGREGCVDGVCIESSHHHNRIIC